jgi:hypothetical protein
MKSVRPAYCKSLHVCICHFRSNCMMWGLPRHVQSHRNISGDCVTTEPAASDVTPSDLRRQGRCGCYLQSSSINMPPHVAAHTICHLRCQCAVVITAIHCYPWYTAQPARWGIVHVCIFKLARIARKCKLYGFLPLLGHQNTNCMTVTATVICHQMRSEHL